MTWAERIPFHAARASMTVPTLNYVSCPEPAGSHRMAYWLWGAADAPHVVVCAHGLSRQGRDFDVLARALVERSPQLVRSLEATRTRLNAQAVSLVRADAWAWLQATPAILQDLVLLDPPYHDRWLERLLPVLAPWLAPGGRIYTECEFALTDAWLQTNGAAGFEVIRAGRAGRVHSRLVSTRG